MKKIQFFAFLMVLGAGMIVASCDDDDDDNTPENSQEEDSQEENTENTLQEVTVTFEEDYWDALIDDPQYGGSLLYGEGCNDYSWTDETTSLHGALTLAWGGYSGYSEGGSAISNYIDDELENHADYLYQLAVPVSNGSKNFVVVYCDASLNFADGEARLIKSMDICPTTYVLGTELYGNYFANALGNEGDFLTLTITADNGKSIDIDLARDSYIMQDWTTVSLEELEEVTSLYLSISGSDVGEWGLNTPTYFAFDNVVIYQ